MLAVERPPMQSSDKSASAKDGYSAEEESKLRAKSVLFIHQLATTLKLHSLVVASASVYFHKFFMSNSFKKFNRLSVASVAVLIASKVEETPRKAKDIVLGFLKLMNTHELDFTIVLTEFLVTERILLQTLGFELAIAHPYAISSTYLKDLKMHIPRESLSDFRQAMCSFLNDSYYSTLCLRYTADEISKGVFLLSTVKLSLNSEQSFWLKLLKISTIEEKRIHELCLEILEVYSTMEVIAVEEERLGSSTAVRTSSSTSTTTTTVPGGHNTYFRDLSATNIFDFEDVQELKRVKYE